MRPMAVLKFAFLALLCVAVLSSCAWIRSWGDPKPDEPAELVDFNETLEVRRIWSTGVGDGANDQGINLQPAFLAGMVYAADHEGRVFAVDSDSGRISWRVDTEVPVSAGPGVSNERVLLGASNGQVVALSRVNGSEQWRAALSSEVLAVPIEHAGIVLVRTIDGRVYGFDADNGTREWVVDKSVPLLTLRGNSTPIASGGRVYIGYDNGQMLALNIEDGTTVWEQTVVAQEGRTELDRLADLDGRMMLLANDLYVASYKGRLASLDAASGRLLWFKDVASANGLDVQRTDLAVADRDGSLWLLDRRNGTTQWKLDDLARRGLTAPAIYNDQVVVGDAEGYLHWIDRETGQFTARQKIDGDGFASHPFVVGTTLYLQTHDGELMAFRAGPAI